MHPPASHPTRHPLLTSLDLWNCRLTRSDAHGRYPFLQVLRKALPLLQTRQLETFRESFLHGREHFNLQELILAALGDPALQAAVKKAETQAARRAKSKPAGKGKRAPTSRIGRAADEACHN
jgi:hypothetical protein